MTRVSDPSGIPESGDGFRRPRVFRLLDEAVTEETRLSMPLKQVRVQIDDAVGVVEARRVALEMSRDKGFDKFEQALVAIAVSEIARNIWRHGTNGYVSLCCAPDGSMRVEARDSGAGMAADQVATANQGGGDPGSGLAIARRAMDELHVSSGAGGTVIKLTKQRRNMALDSRLFQ